MAEIAAAGRSDRDVIGEASVCSARSARTDSVGVLRLDVLGRPMWISPQPLVARAAFLGGAPDPRDDGAAWTGRGTNVFLRGGLALDVAWFHIVGAPQFWAAQNKSFEIFPSPDAARSSLASPWYFSPFSIDLPSRLGVRPISQIDLGESAAWATVGLVDAGVTASTQRWGPSGRGGLVLSADAPGVPRIFARTSRPIPTPVGNFSATAFAGALTESRYFDRDSANDIRSLTAWNVAWTASDSSIFVVGIAHAAQRAGSRFFRSGAEQRVHGPSDQINEVYLEIRDWRSGIRAWTEIGRSGSLPTDQQFFSVPYQGLAYIVGVERAVIQRSGTFLISLEAANLDQPTDLRGGVRQDFYTSARIPQGWSQRGQVLGDAVGPGGQSQWVSADWIAKRWSFGMFVDRVRWNEDALLREYLAYPNRHDVTIRGGARGGLVAFGNEITVEASLGHRLNYLFQNAAFIPGYRTVDLSIPALRFAISPAMSVR